MRRIPLFLVLVTIMAGGCASTGGSSAQSGDSPDVLRAAEIDDAYVDTAWEAVQRLRPQMLRGRGNISIRNDPGGPVVYVDGISVGDVNALHSIRAADVRLIRYLDARDATTRFGTGHAAGVILVETRSGG